MEHVDSTSCATHESLTEITAQVAILAAQHGLPGRRPSSKLKPGNLEEFNSKNYSVVDRLGRAVCRVGKIPRKEFFEAWAVARCVHAWKPRHITRIADVAAGHGLLAWILLVLHLEDHKDSNHDASLLSAVCVDTSMPETADRLQQEILQEWPQLRDHWDYVEGLLEGIESSAEVLIVGVHACGVLTDKLICKALQGGSPIAVLPCCHSRKCLSKVDLEMLEEQENQSLNLTSFLDTMRIKRLQDSGWRVVQCQIPDNITPKNRLFLADFSSSTVAPEVSFISISKKSWWQPQWEWQRPTLSIPLADTAFARKQVRAIAGRSAANARRQPSPIHLGLCIILPSRDEDITVSILKPFIESILKNVSSVTLRDKNGVLPHYDAATDVYTRTVVVTYNDIFDKATAQKWHGKITDAIPVHFSGVSLLNKKPRAKPVPLDLLIHLPDQGDVVLNQVHAAVEALVDVPCTVQLISRRQPYRDPGGRLMRIFRMFYSVETVAEAEQYHQLLSEGLHRHIPGASATTKKPKKKSK